MFVCDLFNDGVEPCPKCGTGITGLPSKKTREAGPTDSKTRAVGLGARAMETVHTAPADVEKQRRENRAAYWVRRSIDLFRELHEDAQTLLIVDGEHRK
jgi:hypothetical protein